MLPKGILFDLDDTILAYTSVAEQTWRNVCETYSANDDRLDPVVLYETIDRFSNWYWNDSKRHREGRLDLNAARRFILEQVLSELHVENLLLSRQIADAFSDQRERDIYLFEGAEETLAYLTRRGILLALITNGAEDKQRAKIRRFGLDRYFKSIWIEGAVGFGKPDEAVYVCAMESLDLTPDKVWFVGDNLEWDVAAPQELGIFGIWNDYDRRGLAANTMITPDRIIHSIRELME